IVLQNSGTTYERHIGGFPVSVLFMVCKSPEIANEHHAKVYGKAAVGAPPMSVPHLDTRYINNEKSLLFGPFAGFTPKFLTEGSIMDLPSSIMQHIVFIMHVAGQI